MNKTTSFASRTDHLSLWEAAHRWTGKNPNETAGGNLPSDVKDILFCMMHAQINSQLRVVKPTGIVLKDWSYLCAENFRPHETDEWDGTDEHHRELYLERMDRVIQPHEKLIANHAAILASEKPIERTYLQTIHVNQTDLARWAIQESLPFPEFWFSADERKQLEREIHPESPPENEREAILNKPGRLTETDIDRFWQRLADKQRHRLLCRAVAEELWRKDSTRTIADIMKDPVIQGYCGGAYYSDPKTLRAWINDLDPRPIEGKRGRPVSK